MTREEWFTTAVRELRKLFRSHGYKLPRRIMVAVGFPSGGLRSSTIAECWQADISGGTVQIFISPLVSDRVEALTVLTHELIHAYLDNEGGHGHKFQRIARDLGLTSPWVEAHAGKTLTEEFLRLSKKLGRYPNPVFGGVETAYNKQKTRLIKTSCEDCGYIARVTELWLRRGLPLCGICHKVMRRG